MEELNLNELLKYYINKIPVILLLTLLSLTIGYIYINKIQTPMYHGTTTIILVQKSLDNQSITQQTTELTLNEKLVTTYTEIIKSRRVLNQVIKKLNLKTTNTELAKRINVTSISETSIIKIVINDKDKQMAAKTANTLAGIFKEEIGKFYDLENISVIDEAIVENKPYNIQEEKQLIISACIGFTLACIIIFAIYYFDNTIKNKKEIENKLGLAVVGEIPLANKLGKRNIEQIVERRIKQKREAE